MKTLDEIKDEYVKEGIAGCDTWNEYRSKYPGVVPSAILDDIATRFAAEQTAQMKADILELRKATLKFVDTKINIGSYSAYEIIEAGSLLREALTKTAHYDNTI